MPTIKTARQAGNELSLISQNLGNPIFSTFYTTSQNYHRGYDYNQRRNSESRTRWDCSELSSALMLQQIDDMRDTNVKWRTDFKKLEQAFHTGSTTAHQLPSLERMGLDVTRGKQNVMNAELKPGMVIFLNYPKTSGGYSGHVATVTRNPETGQLLIAESIGGRNNTGVIHRTPEEFFTQGRIVNNRSTRFSLIDPFQKDRAMLDKFDEQSKDIREAYAEAIQEYRNGGLSRVSGNSRNARQSRMEFLENFVEERLKGDGQHDIIQETNLKNALKSNLNSDNFSIGQAMSNIGIASQKAQQELEQQRRPSKLENGLISL